MKKYIIGLIFLALAIGARLIPHAPNFAPVAALALWAGFYLPKRIGLILPIAAMFLSDIFIGFYDLKLMAIVYASFALITVLGWFLKQYKSVGFILLGSLAGSVFFYLATNFAVWAYSEWYPHTIQGLIFCYTMAIPFFKNTLLGDLFYNAVFFGAYEIAIALIKKKQFAFSRQELKPEVI